MSKQIDILKKGYTKMSEVLYFIEREGIIDSFDTLDAYYINSLEFAEKYISTS